jgi:GntR family transcriptional regulator
MSYREKVGKGRTTSYYPVGLITSILATCQNAQPVSGDPVSQLQALGITVTHVREIVRARMPTASELTAFRLPEGTPVLSVTRQTYVRDEVVEVASDIALPNNRFELECEITCIT